MKRFALLAALILAAPAFAHEYPGDDDGWQQDEAPPPQQGAEDYGYGNSNTQYGQPPPQQQPYGQPPPPMPGEPYGEPPPSQGYAQPPGYGQPPPGYAQPPQEGPTYTDFEDDPSMRSYGVWIDSEYGRVWRPTRVEPGWQPYLFGHWAWTNAGWAWISDEPFGWATYHYGRWAVLDDGSWVWLPGRVWAPAWVAWRYDDGYAAWCPLGPRSIVYEQPRRWVVVDERHFLDPVHTYVVPVQRRREFIGRVHTYYRGPRAGPPVVTIGRATGREVRPLVIHDSGSRRPDVSGGTVGFYRPRTAPVVVHGTGNRGPVQRQAPPAVQHQAPVQRPPEHVYVQPNRNPPPVQHENRPPVVQHESAPPVVQRPATVVHPPPVQHEDGRPPGVQRGVNRAPTVMTGQPQQRPPPKAQQRPPPVQHEQEHRAEPPRPQQRMAPPPQRPPQQQRRGQPPRKDDKK